MYRVRVFLNRQKGQMNFFRENALLFVLCYFYMERSPYICPCSETVQDAKNKKK